MQPTFLRSILAATDLTVASDEPLRAAAALAAATGAALHVVHALDPAAAPSLADSADPAYRWWTSQADEALALQLARTLPPGTEPASRTLALDPVHRVVLERAAAVGADLIVLGPHRGRPGGAPLLGSTADRVLRAAEVPCLIVRGRLALPLARIVVPFDLSEPAPGALREACRWLGNLGDGRAGAGAPELDVVHVVAPVSAPGTLPGNRAAIDPPLHAAVEAARAGHPGVAVREELVWGESPAGEIAVYAGRRRAGLVVLATHGRGALRRALLGSVASGVAAGAPCPVLLLPPSLWARHGLPAGDLSAASAPPATGGEDAHVAEAVPAVESAMSVRPANPGAPDPECGTPGGGKGRRDEVGGSGVYPVSAGTAPADAVVRTQAGWGTG